MAKGCDQRIQQDRNQRVRRRKAQPPGRSLSEVSEWCHLKPPEVMVILTPKEGVTRQQIIAIVPSEIRETVSSISMGNPPLVFAGRW